MKVHHSKTQLCKLVIETFPFSKITRLYILSQLYKTYERNIGKSQQDEVPLTPVAHMNANAQVEITLNRAVLIPDKMRPHLIPAVFQVCIIRKVILIIIIFNRTHSFRLRLNLVHDPYLINDPDNRRFPVHALQDSLQRFIRGHLVGELLSTYAQRIFWFLMEMAQK